MANISDCALQGGGYIWELNGFLEPEGEMAENGGVGLMGEGASSGILVVMDRGTYDKRQGGGV